jgi:DNA (cytosine-5)-methyltransferase 1
VKQLFIHGIGGPVNGLVVDLFAGGGGASTGIEQAIGRAVDLAINHDPAAVKMHEANHPGTFHRCESIFDVDPVQATKGQPVAMLWASPSCTHFSRARGGTPVSKQLRGLGWMVLKWAGKVRPAVIICENVAEWQTWGPVRKGQPWARRKGAYWKLFLASLERLGYTVGHQVLDAADYGAPTHRRRLFLVARCDGVSPVVAPPPTHGPKRGQPYRTAAECIDWSDLGRSIFDRKKPLAAATCRRIAAGIVRYVLKGKPFLVQTGYGERKGQAPRVMPVEEPLGTIVAGGCKHALVSAFLAKHYGGVVGQEMGKPLGTVTAVDHHSLVSAHLTTIDQQSNPAGHTAADAPLSTVTHKQRHALVAAFLTTYYSGGDTANPVSEPVPTIVSKARHGLVTVDIDGTTYALADIRLRMLKPAELARAQGFPEGYFLTGTQAEQIGRIGNSVCPPVAAALVRANLPAVREAMA